MIKGKRLLTVEETDGLIVRVPGVAEVKDTNAVVELLEQRSGLAPIMVGRWYTLIPGQLNAIHVAR
jgi:hypothetical protein